MSVHDAEHDFKNSVFKVILYVKYEIQIFLVLKSLTGWWLVHLVGGLLIGWWMVNGRWSVSWWF